MRTTLRAANWIVGGLLAAALALAPIAPAFGCPPGEMQNSASVSMNTTPAASAKATAQQARQMNMGAMPSAPGKPCDAPCKDCPSDAKKACAGVCVFAHVMIGVAPVSPAVKTVAALVEPHRFSAPTLLARPPDTPPPRSLA